MVCYYNFGFQLRKIIPQITMQVFMGLQQEAEFLESMCASGLLLLAVCQPMGLCIQAAFDL